MALSPVAIAILGIDHFKHINDQFGHDARGAVLRQVASILLNTMRATDIVCRIGGEEFLVILPAQTAPEAAASMDRCRAAIAEHPFDIGTRKIPLTISCGIAARQSTIDRAQLMKETDEALYTAKHQGRNAVVLARHHPPTAA